jgi:hypothetical protein
VTDTKALHDKLAELELQTHAESLRIWNFAEEAEVIDLLPTILDALKAQVDAVPVDFKNSERANQMMMEQGSQRLLESMMQFFKERERKINAAKP